MFRSILYTLGLSKWKYIGSNYAVYTTIHYWRHDVTGDIKRKVVWA